MESEAGEIIVKFREGISETSIRSFLLAEGVNILDRMDNLGLILVSVPKGQELEKIEELKRNPLVEYAEPNGVVRMADTIAVEFRSSLRAPDVIPDDPRYHNNGQWNLPQIEAPAAWDITTGSDEVVIAFVDSGVDFDHPELRDKIWTNPKEIPGNGIDDDGNGFADDVHGWDWVNWDGEPQDDYWHGTFISSIAAAETNNGDGMAGVSWGARIMPVKVFDDQWYSQPWHITGGIEYAADNGAKIINLSWRLTGSEYPQALQTAVDYAHSQGALVVAAAGDSFNSSYKYPAALDHVVSVAATGHEDVHPDFSTHNDKVDVAAPGVDILGISSPLGFEYGRLASTEAAASHVSGLAALIWSVNPALTPDQVESIMESTAVDLGEPGRDNKFGHGRIDAAAAVMTTTHYLEIEPDDGLYFLVCDDCEPPSRKITNPNTSCSTWSATAAVPWLSISPCEGYTPSWVTVSINKGDLPGYGLHTTPITTTSIMTNHVNNPTTITATVNYPSQCWRSYLPLLFKDYNLY
jgi:subtilisin family serine protease